MVILLAWCRVISTTQTNDIQPPLGSHVMVGLVTAIRRGTSGGNDGRDKPGHDGEGAVGRANGHGGWHYTPLM
jgi:hypothetical protein